MLEWQVALGADEAVQDAPVNRYALTDKPARVAAQQTARATAALARPPVATSDILTHAVAEARASAAAATDVSALAAALAAFPHCDLRHGAKSLVFSDGQPAARLMIVGDAPDRDEDTLGRPFVGKAGQLLDRMLAAIGLSRTATDPAQAVYLTTVSPWRPSANGNLEPGDIAMLLPFLERHIALADPDLIVLMGNAPCQVLLDRSGITRLRGQWVDVLGKPALPMLHPTYLLRQPAAKREAWADLLALKSRLQS